MIVDGRKTETFVVPEGRCFVTIVDAGTTAFEFQQKAFHKLCKVATTGSASGRQAHTWLSNPIVYKAEIENYMDKVAKRPMGTTQLHIAYGDFEEEELRTTPKFFGQSFIDDTTFVVKKDGSHLYDISICKAGSYFLENAGAGDYQVIKRKSEDGDLTEDEVLSVYDGSVFPTVVEIVGAKVQSQIKEPDEWVGETAFHTQWKDAINHNEDLHIGRNKVLDLLNEREGRGVFYNLACRVVMKSQVVGARTRSIVGAVKALEEAAAAAVAPHVAAVNEGGTVARSRQAENAATAAAEAAVEAARKAQFEQEQATTLGVTVAVYRKFSQLLDTKGETAATEYITKFIGGGTRRICKGGRRTRKLR